MQLPETYAPVQSGVRILRRMASQEAEQAPTTSCYPTPSKPIDIRASTRPYPHFNTAPAHQNFQDTYQRRPQIYSKPAPTHNYQEDLQRTYGMEQQFPEYPERILEEAIQRMNWLYKYSSYYEQDKENTTSQATSQQQRRQHPLASVYQAYSSGDQHQDSVFMIDGTYEGPSMGYDDLLNEETDTESLGSDCQSNCCCAADNYETDYESLTPTEFRSVGDIIGYAKVVRAQRQEALGQLNSVMNQFSDAWTTMRKQLEERRAAAAQQNQA